MKRGMEREERGKCGKKKSGNDTNKGTSEEESGKCRTKKREEEKTKNEIEIFNNLLL
jgi:hypothetical protein